jgi:hypothetical protein
MIDSNEVSSLIAFAFLYYVQCVIMLCSRFIFIFVGGLGQKMELGLEVCHGVVLHGASEDDVLRE